MYCGSKTKVANSRAQARSNQIWRRRTCLACGSIFTSREAADLSTCLMIAQKHQLSPFDRDRLFTSIYGSCGHRASAVQDASMLTQTIIANVLRAADHGVIHRDTVVRIAHEVLSRFDAAAGTHYGAYHPAR